MKLEETNELECGKSRNRRERAMVVGMTVGLAIGAFFDMLAVGMTIGLSIGLLVGELWSRMERQ